VWAVPLLSLLWNGPLYTVNPLAASLTGLGKVTKRLAQNDKPRRSEVCDGLFKTKGLLGLQFRQLSLCGFADLAAALGSLLEVGRRL
jgi:hypothetical protein